MKIVSKYLWKICLCLKLQAPLKVIVVSLFLFTSFYTQAFSEAFNASVLDKDKAFEDELFDK